MSSDSSTAEEPIPEYDYFGYKELYVTNPDVCGGDLLDVMNKITTYPMESSLDTCQPVARQ